jgi:hypothetical protein
LWEDHDDFHTANGDRRIDRPADDALIEGRGEQPG